MESSYIASLRAQRRLGEATSTLSRTFEKLSSGLRINRASDDAAGLAVASSLNVSRRVFNQGVRNLGDGISLLNVADATLGQLSGITVRLQELASQASNGSYSSIQRAALDTEAQQLANEFFRLSRSATFGRLNLFDGSIQGFRVQNGFGLDGGISSSLGGKLGTGSFLATGMVVDSANEGHVTSDFNNDGNADLASIKSGTLTIRYGTGGGSFSSATSVNLGPSAASKNQLAVGDVDGDGRMDIVASGDIGAQVVYNRGNGTYSVGTAFTVAPFADGQGGFLVDDINSDGRADIIAAGYLADAGGLFLRAYTSQGNDSFSLSWQSTIAESGDTGMGAGAVNMLLTDTNNDGLKDLVVGTNYGPAFASSGYLNIATGRSSGGFGSFSTALTISGTISDFAVGDLNRDGRVDIALSAIEDGGTALTNYTYTGSGQGSFTQRQSYGVTVDSTSLLIKDLNGDGWNDLLERRSDGVMGVRLGRGDGTVGGFAQISASSSGVKSLVVSDFNNDGVSDLFDAAVGIYQGVTRDGIAPLEPFSLKSKAEALQALPKFSQSLERLTLQRGQIGALQSRFEAALNVTRSSSDNFSAASARITDVDVAESSAALTRAQILQSVASAVLSQANQLPQITLALLNG